MRGIISRAPWSLALKALIPCSILYLCKLRIRPRPTKCSSSAKHGSEDEKFDSSGVSERVRGIAFAKASAMSNAWDLLSQNPYHPITNPNGCINLAIAENKLLLDLLYEWFEKNSEALLLQKEGDMSLKNLSSYPDFGGIPPLKKAMAGFMDLVLGGDGLNFSPSNVVIASGATSIMELLAFCLADPGDAFLIPAPYYPGFDRDIHWRSQVRLIPFHEPDDRGMGISLRSLTEAWEQAEENGIRVRALLLSSPSNPTGRTYPKETLVMLLEFCRTKQIHCISDEVYAGSVYGGDRFVSMMKLAEAEKGDLLRVHVMYSLSKDLGLAGFRTGVLYTCNPHVHVAMSNLSRMCLVPMHTQMALSLLLSDREFMSKCMEENVKRLKEKWELIEKRLTEIRFDFVTPEAGLFVWVNLGFGLGSWDAEGEMELLSVLANDFGIVMNPGQHCHTKGFGWFRICFGGLEHETLVTALDRLALFVSKTRTK